MKKFTVSIINGNLDTEHKKFDIKSEAIKFAKEKKKTEKDFINICVMEYIPEKDDRKIVLDYR